MGKRDPRVDAYIATSADFAKPILVYVRAVVHASCPDVEESMTWSRPHFTYKGMLCGMASFKQHAALHFWKGSLVLGRSKDTNAMGPFGRLTKVSDLPSKTVLAGYIRKAAALNNEGVRVEHAPKRPAPKTLRIPPDLTAVLKQNTRAQAAFEAFSPSHKREYVEWVTEAKSDETRARRLRTAVEWIDEGKSRNWKYERK